MHKSIKFVPYRIDINIAYDYALWILYPEMSDLFKWIIVIVVLKQLSRLGYFYFLGGGRNFLFFSIWFAEAIAT